MQSTENPIARLRLVVLDELDVMSDMCIELGLFERLKEVTSCVIENLGFNDPYPLNVSLSILHRICF